MRLVLAVLVAALPLTAHAQQRATPRLPSLALPLPRITPQLPSIGLPPAPAPPDASIRMPVPGRSDGDRGRRHGRRGPTPIVLFPVYGWSPFVYSRSAAADWPVEADRRSAPRTVERMGTLRLPVEPFTQVQVYVDGVFVGTASDLRGEIEIAAGVHRIELRADGYRSVTFDVRIPAGGVLTYGQGLEPLQEPDRIPQRAADAAGTPAPDIPRTTVYLIPGCYLGNVPPAEAGLPPTCDPGRATTFEP